MMILSETFFVGVLVSLEKIKEEGGFSALLRLFSQMPLLVRIMNRIVLAKCLIHNISL